MSLLRRIERNREARAGDGAAEPPSGTADPPRASHSPIHELWHHTAVSKLFVVAITSDSRFIIAGGQGGEILFFDIAGRLLWRGQVEGAVNRLAVAEDADCFVAGTIEHGRNAYLWHFSGQLLHTLETDGEIWGVGITPDASLIIVASLDMHLYAFNRDGESLFKQPVEGAIRHLALTADGEMIVAGSDDHRIYAYDRAGQQRWTFPAGGRVWAGIRIAEQARVLVAGSNDGFVYGLDFDGRERWRFNTGGLVNNLVITPDGRMCAAAGQSNTVHLLNEQGNVLWEYQTGDHIYGLDLTPGGHFMAVGSHDHAIHLIDHRNGHRAWKHSTGGRVYGVAMTPNGQFFAAACADQTLYVFKNTLAADDPEWLTRPVSKPLMRLVVQRVRAEYAITPLAGLLRWFSEFEKSLRSGQFDACRALLDEVHGENGMALSESEKLYTRSLEGVFWLLRGAAHHRLGQTAEARACYEQSKTIQESLNNQDGAGQVIAALSLLPPEDNSPEELADGPGDHARLQPAISEECLALLDEITSRPRVLGLSEKLLAQRLSVVSPTEQLEIILLARQSGYLSPLLKGLSAQEHVVRAAASAALAMLEPGPDYAVLEKMLASEEPFVQWQALRILRARARDHADQFAEMQATLWPAVLSPAVASAPAPLTRREAILLLKDAGSASDTPWLLERLDDPDVDVQIAATEALGEVGDRRALLRLKRVQSRSGFLGRDLAMAAADARNAIEVRHPLPTIEQVILCGDDPLLSRSVRESTLFLSTAETVYGIITVDHVQPGAQITVRWRDGDRVLREDEITVPEDQPRVAEIHETVIVEQDQGGIPPGGRRPFRRSPLGRDNSEEPRFTPFRRRTVDDSDDSDDADAPLFPRRRSLSDREDREESGFAGSSRPLFPRRETANTPARPSIFADRPRPFGERPSSGGSAPDRPGRSPFGTGRHGSPFGRRDDNESGDHLAPAVRAHDPNENVEPTTILAASSDQPPGRPPSPFGGRFDRPSRPDRSREADLPPWLRQEQDDDEEPVRRRPGFNRPPPVPMPFTRPGAERPPLGGRFGRPSEAPNHRPSFGRSPRADRSSSSRQLVMSLPRPVDGWKNASYLVEVLINGESSKRETSFKFIDSLKLLGLEPGIAALNLEDFSRTSVFLSGTQYIDCLAHLEEAPVDTSVRGRLYNRVTGTLLAESSVVTTTQGHQAVQLSWENMKWPPGHYRVAVSVAQGNELSTDIEVVSKVQADQIILCHRVDKNSGPIGTNWPFRPGDNCCCVVEFRAPPPGVEVSATWYRKGEAAPITQARPVTATAETDQRKVFNLGHAPLKPGHYSVIIEGKNLIREERSFEVLPYSRAQVAARFSQTVSRQLSPLMQKYPLVQVMIALVLTGLLAAAFWLADHMLTQTVEAGARSRDVMLQIAHAMGQPGIVWALAWLAFGMAYGIFYARYGKKLGDEIENRVYESANSLLVFAGGALAWYLAITILFGAGYDVWPDQVRGLFGRLRWLTPLIAWCAPLVGTGLALWRRGEDQAKPFHLGVLRSVMAAIGIVLAGWTGAVLVGLPIGLLGRAFANVLDMVSVRNDLSGGFLTFGAALGFAFGTIGIFVYGLGGDLAALRKAWQQERKGRPGLNLLRFLAEASGVPISEQVFRAAAGVAIPMLVLISGTTLVIWTALEPVLLPVLEFVYHPADRAGFERAVMAGPLAVALALALLLVWPMLVWGIYRRLVLPVVGNYRPRFFRLYSLAAAALVGLVPAAALVAARSLMNGDLEAELGIYWTNRVALAVVFTGFALWQALLIRYMPNTLRSRWAFRLSSTDQAVNIAVIMIAGLLLPGWMWAILVVTALAVLSSGALLYRIR